MNKVLLLILCIAVQLCMAQKTGVMLSDKRGWHKIAETRVSFKHDTDYITVVGADKFAQVKIRIENAPVHLISFDIFFEAGDTQTVFVDQDLKAPGETQVVAFKGGERTIEHIRFVYKSIPGTGRKQGRVELWGLKTNTDKGKPK